MAVAVMVIAWVLFGLTLLAVLASVYALGVDMGRKFSFNERRDSLAQDERRMMAVELEYRALKEQGNMR